MKLWHMPKVLVVPTQGFVMDARIWMISLLKGLPCSQARAEQNARRADRPSTSRAVPVPIAPWATRLLERPLAGQIMTPALARLGTAIIAMM